YLEHYAWPGNVRELRNVIERAALLSSGDVILPVDLPGHVTNQARDQMPEAVPVPQVSARPDETPVPEETTERQRIIDALEHCAGNQSRAAKVLGISRRTLVARLTEYNIPRPRGDREP